MWSETLSRPQDGTAGVGRRELVVTSKLGLLPVLETGTDTGFGAAGRAAQGQGGDGQEQLSREGGKQHGTKDGASQARDHACPAVGHTASRASGTGASQEPTPCASQSPRRRRSRPHKKPTHQAEMAPPQPATRRDSTRGAQVSEVEGDKRARSVRDSSRLSGLPRTAFASYGPHGGAPAGAFKAKARSGSRPSSPPPWTWC